MLAPALLAVAEVFLPDDPKLGNGFGGLKTAASSYHEYIGVASCSGQPHSQVGILGPWWNNTAVLPEQAFALYESNTACVASDIGICIEGAGCGPQRVLFTAGSNTSRRTPPGESLWNLYQALSPTFAAFGQG